MSRQVTVAIVSDGGTDRALSPILTWAIHQIDPTVDVVEPEFRKRHGSVAEYLAESQLNAQITFMHRDAESASSEERLAEYPDPLPPSVVPVITVRMTEAWLLIDPSAIAKAAGSPRAIVQLPPIRDLESLADPKEVLEDALWAAARPSGSRRRKAFSRDLVERRVSVAFLIDNYEPLKQLSAFQEMMTVLRRAFPYGPAA